MLSIIVAKSKNNVIGNNNQLIWHIKDDLKRFKELTTNHNIIMGRKTFESLGRVLPNRKHIVFTKDKKYTVNDENVKIIYDIEEIYQYINDENENFVIGGAQIYKMLLPYCKKLYITQIHKEFEGDVYFPLINEKEWKLIGRENGPKDENDFRYDYLTFEKV